MTADGGVKLIIFVKMCVGVAVYSTLFRAKVVFPDQEDYEVNNLYAVIINITKNSYFLHLLRYSENEFHKYNKHNWLGNGYQNK